MNKGTVTVVIPIYNVEKYLDCCIKSVVEQSYKNLEILLIDDGSPDNCPSMCDAWAKKDERIRVIHKTNAGLGMARNTGIENATGEYICFFDSDDYVAQDTIEKAYSIAQKNGSDVVVFGFNSVDASGNIIKTFIPIADPQTYSGSAVLDDFLPEYISPDPKGDGKSKFFMSSCMAFYSLDMIKQCEWRFVSEREIISEDVYSLLGLFAHVKSVSVLPEALYFYCENSSSLSRNHRSDRYTEIKYFYTESIKLCDNLGYSKKIKERLFEPFLSFSIAAMKQECALHDTAEAYKKIKNIMKDNVLQLVLKNIENKPYSVSRKVLFFVLRHKLYFLAYLLLALKQ